MVILRLATWNVRTVDNEERRVNIVQELEEHNIDIACLQETKLLQHEYTPNNTNYTIYSPGSSEGKCPYGGVGFSYKTNLSHVFVETFSFDPKRLQRIKIKLDDKIINLINIYAPTNSKITKPEEKDKFYSCLETAFSDINESETVFIVGDFNAQVGADNIAWPACLGQYGVGEINDNGQRLLEFCSRHDLCVLNTYTELPEREQFTHQNTAWMTWSQLDLCITRVRDRHKVISTKPVPNLRNLSDHKMVILEIELTESNIQPNSNSENIQQQKLFRYLLRSVPIVMMTKKSLPIDKKKNALIETLFSDEIFKNYSKCINILQKFINESEKYFDDQDILLDEVIKAYSNTIIQVSNLFLKDTIVIEENEFLIRFEEVKRYITERQEFKIYEKADILKGELSEKEVTEIKEFIHKYCQSNQLEGNYELTLETETVKCCGYFVLPREFMYLFICQQCMNIANLPRSTIPQSKDFSSTLRDLLTKCMLQRLNLLVKDDELQEYHIFKCTKEKEMLFALNLLQEKCLQKVVPLYILFVDLSQILASGTTAMFVESSIDQYPWALNLSLLFSEARGKATDNEIELMTFILSYILKKSFDKPDGKLIIKYRFDGKIFNQSRLNAQKTKTFSLRVIQYKSYAAIFSTEINDVKECIDNIEKTCKSIGLSFVQNEPVILEQNVTEFATELPKGSKAAVLSENVNFLGVNFTGKEFSLETDTFLRIHNACKKLQTEPNISYEAILKDLMRHLEVLSLTKKQEEALDNFYDRCLRNKFELESDPNGISRRLHSARMDLLGTYHRDKSDSIAKRILYGDLDVERQTVSYFSNLKKDMKSLNIEQKNWEKCAQDQKTWESKIKTIRSGNMGK